MLTFYPVLFHLLHLCDGLPEVVCKLFAVLRVRGVKVNKNLNVCARQSRSETHSIGIIWKTAAPEEYYKTGYRRALFKMMRGSIFSHFTIAHDRYLNLFMWRRSVTHDSLRISLFSIKNVFSNPLTPVSCCIFNWVASVFDEVENMGHKEARWGKNCSHLWGHLHWFSNRSTCIPYREKDCLKLYVTEFFFFWKILVTWIKAWHIRTPSVPDYP